MNLNLLLVIMAVVLICMVMDGYKKGMVKSLISLISLLSLSGLYFYLSSFQFKSSYFIMMRKTAASSSPSLPNSLCSAILFLSDYLCGAVPDREWSEQLL